MPIISRRASHARNISVTTSMQRTSGLALRRAQPQSSLLSDKLGQHGFSQLDQVTRAVSEGGLTDVVKECNTRNNVTRFQHFGTTLDKGVAGGVSLPKSFEHWHVEKCPFGFCKRLFRVIWTRNNDVQIYGTC